MIVEKNFEITSVHCRPRPRSCTDVTIGVPIALRTAARFANTDTDELILLNPALSEAVDNRVPVPPHYNLRVPWGAPGISKPILPGS
jgi:hypothetical protein